MPNLELQFQRIIPGNRIRFIYTNWKGITAVRECIFESIGVGVTEYHHKHPTWFINGLDQDKGERRQYDLAKIEVSSVEVL